MSQHSTGVLVAELLETFLGEVEESLDKKRIPEATNKVKHLRARMRAFIERTDRVLSIRELMLTNLKTRQ